MASSVVPGICRWPAAVSNSSDGWPSRRPFGSGRQRDDDDDDPAAKILQGQAKLQDLTLDELTAALAHRGVTMDHQMASNNKQQHDDSNTTQRRAALQKRLVQELLLDQRTEATQSAEQEAYKQAHFQWSQRVPRQAFAVAPALTGHDKPVLVYAPLWELEKLQQAVARQPDAFDGSPSASAHLPGGTPDRGGSF